MTEPSSAGRAASAPGTAVLLITCEDRRGLVAEVADFLYRAGGNILDADQHTDPEAGLFLQRIEWQLAGFTIPRERIAVAFAPLAERFGMRWQLHFTDVVPRLALLVSRLDHCLPDLLWRLRAGELQAEVVAVISNHDDLRSSVESLGLPYTRLPEQGRDDHLLRE